ncbi:MAG: type 4a pilus biogenesis protein PilO [Phycisphaeraceae bacterium]
MRFERDQVRTLMIFAVLGAVFALGLWLPMHYRGGSLRQRVEEAQRQIAGDRARAASLDELDQEIAQLKAALNNSPGQVPQTGELANLLRRVSNLMHAQDLKEQQVVTQSVTQGQDFSIIPLSLEFKGTFTQVARFVREVETMERLIRVTRLEVRGVNKEPGGPVSVGVDLCTFFAPDNPEDPR